jgi:hypothetical protein
LAGGWCWFVLREEYRWLVAGGWFVLREEYCWLISQANMTERSDQATLDCYSRRCRWPSVVDRYVCARVEHFVGGTSGPAHNKTQKRQVPGSCAGTRVVRATAVGVARSRPATATCVINCCGGCEGSLGIYGAREPVHEVHLLFTPSSSFSSCHGRRRLAHRRRGRLFLPVVAPSSIDLPPAHAASKPRV